MIDQIKFNNKFSIIIIVCPMNNKLYRFKKNKKLNKKF